MLIPEHGVVYGQNAHEAVYVPLPEPNAADLRLVPIGAHCLLVSTTEEGTMFSAARWSASERDRWISDLGDEDKRYEGSVLFYIDPDRLRHEDQPVRSADDIIEQALAEWRPTGDIHSDVQNILRSTIELARDGMTVNPF